MFIIGILVGVVATGALTKFFVKKNDEINGKGSSEKVFNQMKDEVVEKVKNFSNNF
jgi:hypothetical protein